MLGEVAEVAVAGDQRHVMVKACLRDQRVGQAGAEPPYCTSASRPVRTS
jgi:hypothetical protein